MSGLVIGRVTITKILTEDSNVMHTIDTDDGSGEGMGLDDALAMMERAKFALFMAEAEGSTITHGEEVSE